MLRMSKSARPKQQGRLASAVALALAAGAVLGAGVAPVPALAQARPDYSKGFVEIYQPLADIANAEGGDYASVKPQLPAVIAAAETADDRFAAGNLSLVLGNKLSDKVLQRQGLELMLQSGKVDPAQVGQFQFFVGSLAYDAGDWAAARTALEAAVAAGYTESNPEGLIAESYFKAGQSAQGLDYLKQLIDARVAAGEQVPEDWFLRGLKVAYDNQLTDKATEWSALLVEHSPTERNWLQALQVVAAVHGLEGQAQLDLLRLMALTDAMTERGEFVSYIEAADPRIMSNEVAQVLEVGVRKGVFTPADEYYQDVKSVVDERAPADQADAPALAEQARNSSQARDAQNAGDVFLSLGSFAEAEQMFKLAMEKGGADRDQLLTRIGIAQVRQGKLEEAKATFTQVSGARAPVAQMWTAYIQSRA